MYTFTHAETRLHTASDKCVIEFPLNGHVPSHDIDGHFEDYKNLKTGDCIMWSRIHLWGFKTLSPPSPPAARLQLSCRCAQSKFWLGRRNVQRTLRLGRSLVETASREAERIGTAWHVLQTQDNDCQFVIQLFKPLKERDRIVLSLAKLIVWPWEGPN